MSDEIISIIIPTYNNVASIKYRILEIYKNIEDINVPVEIIVVDDNSSDGTGDIVKTMLNGFSNLALIELENYTGYYGALKIGVDNSKGTIVVALPVELPYYFPVTSKFINGLLTSDASIAYGSRFKSQSQINPYSIPPIEWLFTKLLIKLTNRKLHMGISDIPRSFFAITRIAWIECYPVKIDRIFGYKLLVNANRKNLRLIEYPVEYRARQGTSRSSLRRASTFFYSALMYLFRQDLRNIH